MLPRNLAHLPFEASSCIFLFLHVNKNFKVYCILPVCCNTDLVASGMVIAPESKIVRFVVTETLHARGQDKFLFYSLRLKPLIIEHTVSTNIQLTYGHSQHKLADLCSGKGDCY